MRTAIYFGDGSAGFFDSNDLLVADEGKWKSLFVPRTISRSFVNFALSKISRLEAEALIEKLSRYLEIGGYLRIADVDGDHPSADYAAHGVAYGLKWRPTLGELSDILFRYGFSVRPVEFYSVSGKFHVRPRDPIYGVVVRSRLSDHRAQDAKLQFSSLIVDAVLVDENKLVNRTMISEDVMTVFHETLNRDPDSEDTIRHFISSFKTTDALALHLLLGKEFQKQLKNSTALPKLKAQDYIDLYREFVVKSRPSKAGFIVGALGDETDIRYSSVFQEKVQTSIPHHPEYWAVLIAAFTATGGFVAVELGAGFGGWLVKAALAARQRGISDVRVAAVEPDQTKFEWLHENLAHNDIDLSRSLLLRGTVGGADGVSFFPVLDDASVDWGARAISPQQYEALKAQGYEPLDRRGQPYTGMKEYSIQTILAPFDIVDLLHVDIQGHELIAIRAALDIINRRVRFMFVGTHSAAIDAGLIETMSNSGWRALHIVPRHYGRNAVGQFVAGVDGDQLWENTRFMQTNRSVGVFDTAFVKPL
jgi:FkbM family methyltransferase